MAVASAFAHRVVYKSLRFVEGWPVGNHLRPVAVNISFTRNTCNVKLFDVALRQLTDCITSIPKKRYDKISSRRAPWPTSVDGTASVRHSGATSAAYETALYGYSLFLKMSAGRFR